MATSRTYIVRLVTGVVFVNLSVYLLVGLALYLSLLQYEKQTMLSTQNLAHSLELNVSGVLDKTDIAILAVVDEAERQLAGGSINGQALNAIIASQRVRIHELDGLRMTDEDGNIRYGTDIPVGQPVNIADRDYFVQLRDNSRTEVVISKPVQSRIINKWIIVIARRVNHPDGSFAGSVLGILELEHLTRIFSSINVGKRGTITLRDNELAIIARYPEPEGPASATGNKNVSDELLAQLQSNPNNGTYSALIKFDRIKRIISYRKIIGYPWYILVGQATSDYLGDWWKEVAGALSLSALFTMITLFSSWLVYQRRKTDILAREALQAEKDFAQSIIQTAQAIVLVLDTKGNIVKFNRYMEEISGYRLNEVQGKDWFSTFVPQDMGIRTRTRELFLKSIADIETRGNVASIVTKDGRELMIEWHDKTLKDNKGNVAGLLTIGQDVTERKKLEEQLRQSQKMEALGILAGGVAHDFNNILTAIIGYGGLAQMNVEEDPITHGYIQQVLDAADRARDLTKRLLAFSRKQIIEPVVIDLNDIVRNIEEMLRRIIREDIKLSIVLSTGELPVMVDVGQMEQVLMNLAANARDALPEGGHLVIQTDAVNVDSCAAEAYLFENAGMYAVLTVSDTGIGMDQRTKENIFEPFFTTKEVGKGTGLGLSMIYGIIKQHNGNIDVDSEVGKGTTFRIYLPLAQTKREAISETEIKPLSKGKGETILIAEDEPQVREIITHLLQKSGYKIIEAENGEDAVRKFENNRGRVSLVLLDVIMPVRNGREAYEEINGIEPGIKTIFMSGYTDDIISRNGILDEAFDFISKPIDPGTLMRKIRDVLEM